MSLPRRILKVLAIALGVVVLLLGIAVLLIDSSALARWAEERVLPTLEERLGRDVSIASVEVDLFPRPGVALEDLRVAGAGPQPLVAARRVVVHLKLWPLITSRGADVRVTDVELDRPELTILRASNGRWELQDLAERMRSETPSSGAWSVDRIRIEHGLVRFVDSAASTGTAFIELRDFDATLRHIGPGLPLELKGKAALAGDDPNLSASLQLDAMPRQGGPPPRATGRLDLDGIPLSLLRPYLPAGVVSVVTGGSVHAAVNLSTRDDGSYAIQGDVKVPDLRLRGQPASAQATLTATASPAATDRWSAELSDVRVRGPGVDLAGSAQAQGPVPSVRFDIRGPLLDLDTVLGLMPEKPEEPKGPLLSPKARARVAGMDVAGTLAVDRVVSHRMTAGNLQARASLRGGTLRIDEGTASFYGGTANLAGTTVDLRAVDPVWNLRARLAGTDLGLASNAIAGKAPVSGHIGGDVNLRGSGIDWKRISRQLTGQARLELAGGEWSTVGLASQIAEALAPIGGGQLEIPGDRTTKLRRVAVSAQVKDGWMTLSQPLEMAMPFGTGKLTGRIGLDHRIDLRGTVSLTPQYVSQLTGGALQRSVGVPLTLGGTLEAPQVTGVDVSAVANELLPRHEVERRLEQEKKRGKHALEEEARRRARELLQGG